MIGLTNALVPDKSKRPNIIRTLPIAAGNTVAAGDVVDVVGGEVQRTFTGKANVKEVFRNGTTTAIGIANINTEHSVTTYLSGTACSAQLVGNATGKTVGNGATIFDNAGLTNVVSCRLNGSQFVAGYMLSSTQIRARVGSISGTAITFSNEVVIKNGAVNAGIVAPLGDSSFIAIYNDAGLKAKVCTVSGTTIMAGTEYSLSGSTSSIYVSATRIPDDGSNRRVCVCYRDEGDSGKGKAAVATISSSNVVTWSTPTTFRSTLVQGVDCDAILGNVIVAYHAALVGGGSRTFLQMLTVSGSVVTPSGNELDLGFSDTGLSVNYGDGDILLCCENNSRAYAVSRNPTDNSLSVGTFFKYNTSSAIGDAIYISNGVFLSTFSDGANSNYGTATLLTVRGNQIAGSFTDTSSQAIALQSGTSPQSIDIIYDGVAPLSGITAGTQITSAGVNGYAPQDGWLWVRPEWDNAPTGAVYGSYTGQNSDYNTSRLINLGFEPDVVVVTLGEASTISPKSMHVLVRDFNILELKNGIYPAFTAPLAYGYVFIMDIADSGFLVGRGIDFIGQPYKYMALKM